jgi:lipopolysaccharide export system protein LptA
MRYSPRALRGVLLVAAAALGCLGGGSVLAQKNSGVQNPGPPNALQGFSQNRGQPVNIKADSLVVRDKDKVATFSGNVRVVQGDTEMRSKVLVVYYIDGNKPAPATTMTTTAPDSGEQQKIRRIEATGGVTVTQKDQNAVGDKGIFDMASNTVTLTGNVIVTHAKDVVRGQNLVVDLTTGISHMDGRVEALFGSAPNGEAGMPGTGFSPVPLSRPARTN